MHTNPPEEKLNTSVQLPGDSSIAHGEHSLLGARHLASISAMFCD